jgi:hypothetical protein
LSNPRLTIKYIAIFYDQYYGVYHVQHPVLTREYSPMRQIAAFALLAAVAAMLPPSPRPADAQTITCYRKKCLEYPDGYKICELTPVDCSEIVIR